MLLSVLLNVLLLTTLCSAELISVLVIHRHGDRIPRNYFPNDPYNDPKYWPENINNGEITEEGRLNAQELGTWLRQRFTTFLPPKYNSHDIYVRSTDKDRCLTSAAAVLKGLYPTNDIIPIHTLPVEKDHLLVLCNELFSDKCYNHCKRADVLMEKAMKNPSLDMEQFHQSHKTLFATVGQRIGQKEASFQNLSELYDTLSVEQKNNLTLPVWTSSIYPSELHEAAKLVHKLPTMTPELQRLVAGLLNSQIIAHFDAFTEPTKPDPSIPWNQKFIQLSGHDVTLIGVLNSMGLYNNMLPPFSSALIYELHDTAEKGQFINMFYRNSTTSLVQLTLPECGFDCDYNLFRYLLENVTISQEKWETECASMPISSFGLQNTNYCGVYIILGMFLLFLFA